MPSQESSHEKAGAAIEYVLVSTFSTLVAIALLGVASKVFQNNISKVSHSAGIEVSDFDFNPFEKD